MESLNLTRHQVIALSLLLMACLSVGYFERQRHLHFRQELTSKGIVTQAVSYKEECGRHTYDRYYRYSVNNKPYTILESPDNPSIHRCKSPVGDRIDIVYLPNHPEKYMTTWKFNRPLPALIHYLAASIFWFLGIIMALLYIYQKFSKTTH